MKTYNTIYKNRIIGIVKDIGFGTPERIRQVYAKLYLKSISWITIKRHLDRLVEEGLCKSQLISEGKKRDIIIYKSK